MRESSKCARVQVGYERTCGVETTRRKRAAVRKKKKSSHTHRGVCVKMVFEGMTFKEIFMKYPAFISKTLFSLFVEGGAYAVGSNVNAWEEKCTEVHHECDGGDDIPDGCLNDTSIFAFVLATIALAWTCYKMYQFCQTGGKPETLRSLCSEAKQEVWPVAQWIAAGFEFCLCIGVIAAYTNIARIQCVNNYNGVAACDLKKPCSQLMDEARIVLASGTSVDLLIHFLEWL